MNETRVLFTLWGTRLEIVSLKKKQFSILCRRKCNRALRIRSSFGNKIRTKSEQTDVYTFHFTDSLTTEMSGIFSRKQKRFEPYRE